MAQATAGGESGRCVSSGETVHSASYDPVAQGGDRYLKQEKLGEGTYGVVYKAIDYKHNQVSGNSI